MHDPCFQLTCPRRSLNHAKTYWTILINTTYFHTRKTQNVSSIITGYYEVIVKYPLGDL